MATVEHNDTFQITKIETAPFGTNAYIISCRKTGKSVLVDAPGETSRIVEELNQTDPEYILITHSHMDHTGSLIELKSRLDIPVAAHEADTRRLPTSCERLLNDGETVEFGNLQLKVFHTPGHTPGSLCFLVGQCLISGDTIFPGGPGRTDTPLAFEQIIVSIKNKIFVLPDDTRVYPGHGDSTVLAKEKEEFAVFSSRPHDRNLCGNILWLSS